jgi:hypothetical protein
MAGFRLRAFTLRLVNFPQSDPFNERFSARIFQTLPGTYVALVTVRCSINATLFRWQAGGRKKCMVTTNVMQADFRTPLDASSAPI